MPQAPSREIRPLPALLVNQIAAGEVVERPASVVKELLENALDAAGTRIAIELEEGGVELIRITDDGCGIPADQLPLALAPHATSKIAEAADLEKIGTLGFRGEALASIASVSRLSLRSRTSADDGASTLDAEGDAIGAVRPASGPIGTSVTVRNLFFNTPARRKFLRTPQTEQTRCLDVARDLAMAHPAVAFTVSCDGRVLLDVPPGQSPRERALAVLGPELEEQLVDVHADEFDGARSLTLWGLAGLPLIARATNQAQHVFLNGRVIRDKTIQHAIKEAYRGLIEPGRHPTAVLMLELDPGAVDVNVHPAKTEVRFRDSSLVHSIVLRSIREALRRADLTPSFGVAGGGGLDGPRSLAPSRPIDPSAFVDFFKREVPARAEGRISFDALRDAVAQADASAPSDVRPIPDAFPPVPPPAPEPAPLMAARPSARMLQVHNTYVVTQDEQGVVIIDQHALHERVMFEYLAARLGQTDSGALESQRLLTPAIVRATPRQLERLPDLGPLLARVGIEAEPIGPTDIAVHSFPSFLFDRGVDPVDFLTGLFERAESEQFAPGGEQALHEVLDMMACKAAVKAGDRLSETELTELIKLRDVVERAGSCPHGRPTSIRLTIPELDRLFRRA